jgi:hypothetical protein
MEKNEYDELILSAWENFEKTGDISYFNLYKKLVKERE